MDELAAARDELARLEDIERNLVEQLSDVRAVTAAQKKRIVELIRTRPPPIQRLPVELLLSILHLALRGTDPSQKEILARVSRHWRDVIRGHPSFWSAIEIADSRKLSPAVRLHLKKSREAPLDIAILVELPKHESSKHYGTLREGLDLIIPCANRWRTLRMYSWFPASMPRFVLNRIGAIKFPSLKRIELGRDVNAFPTFLSATNVPVLEHLEVGHLMVDGLNLHGTSFSRHIPVLTLVTLTLSGNMPPRLLQPNSVHLPVLETLKISLRKSNDFFEAIVTPKLRTLDYTIGSEDLLSTLFSSLEGKFSSVKQVSFTIKSSDPDTADTLALCKMFPNVCHAEFYSKYPPSFFDPCEGTDAYQPPVCYWKSLESVAFHDMDTNIWVEPPIRTINPVVRWLVERQDQHPLRFRIEGVVVVWEDVPSFCMLYEILQEYCDVELEDVTLCHDTELLKSAGSRLQLYVPGFTSGIVDNIGTLIGGTTKSGDE